MRVTEPGRDQLALVAAPLQPVLECYAALLGAARGLEVPCTRADLLAAARSTLEDQLLLVEDEIVAVDGPLRDADAKLSAGAHWPRLATLLARVAGGIETG